MHMVAQARTALAHSSIALALAAGLALGGGHHAHAAGARHTPTAQARGLTFQDFFDVYPGEVEDVSGTDKATVAGITYAHAIELDRGIAALSYNAHRYPGYTALSFLVGLTDSSDAGSQDTLVVSVDGHPIKTITAQPGHPAVKVVIPFGHSTIIHFSVRGGDPASSGLLIVSPTLLAGSTSTGGAAALTLKDFFDVYPDEVEDVSGTARATIAGITYAHAIELDRGIASLSYNTHKRPGYTALRFFAGLTDSSDAGSQDTLVVSADGRPVKTITARPGSPAVKVVIPFGGTAVIHFSVRGGDPASSGLLIADPTLLR